MDATNEPCLHLVIPIRVTLAGRPRNFLCIHSDGLCSNETRLKPRNNIVKVLLPFISCVEHSTTAGAEAACSELRGSYIGSLPSYSECHGSYYQRSSGSELAKTPVKISRSSYSSTKYGTWHWPGWQRPSGVLLHWHHAPLCKARCEHGVLSVCNDLQSQETLVLACRLSTPLGFQSVHCHTHLTSLRHRSMALLHAVLQRHMP